jgi:hypothetical protein
MPSGTFDLSTTVSSGTTPIQARISWSSSDNAGANSSTFQATLQARRNGAVNFSDRSNFNISFLGGNYGYGGAVNIPSNNVWTTIYSTPAVGVAHNTDGQAGFGVSVTGGRVGTTSWLTTTGGGNVFLTDYVRTPSAVSVASLSRSANGQDISLSSTSSTFYGSGGYYVYRWSYDNASWSEVGMAGTNGSGSGFNSANTIYVQVIAVDSEGNSGWSGSASIAGISAPAWSTATTLTNAIRGTAYSTALSASPATSYELIGQSGAGGLSVASNGVLSGTPTTTGLASLTVRAYNYDRTTDRTFSLTIQPALPVFSDGSVNNSARVGVAYSDGIAASETASYSVFSGALPGGLSLNTTTGAITGTPTTPGIFTFVLRATNVTGSTNTGTLTITVISAARVWNGTTFIAGQARVWNGTSFVTGTIRVWDGSVWKNTN